MKVEMCLIITELSRQAYVTFSKNTHKGFNFVKLRKKYKHREVLSYLNFYH